MNTGTDLSIDEIQDEVNWTSIVERFADYGYEQSYAYSVERAAYKGAVAKFLTIRAGSTLLGAACVRIKRIAFLQSGLAYISGGPLVLENDQKALDLTRLEKVISALKSTIVDTWQLSLYIRPSVIPLQQQSVFDKIFAANGFKLTDRVRGYKTVVLDISLDEAELRRQLHSKWRYHLKHSERQGLTIEIGEDNALATRFTNLYITMKDRKQFDTDIDPDFFFKLASTGTDFPILVAKDQHSDIAAHVLGIHGRIAVYLFGATNQVGRDRRAGYYLHWAAMLYAQKRGCSWYDLGGVDRGSNPGGYQFKTQMGGQLVVSPGPYAIQPVGWTARALDSAWGIGQNLRRLRGRRGDAS